MNEYDSEVLYESQKGWFRNLHQYFDCVDVDSGVIIQKNGW